jgi:hypothetical protein
VPGSGHPRRPTGRGQQQTGDLLAAAGLNGLEHGRHVGASNPSPDVSLNKARQTSIDGDATPASAAASAISLVFIPIDACTGKSSASSLGLDLAAARDSLAEGMESVRDW